MKNIITFFFVFYCFTFGANASPALSGDSLYNKEDYRGASEKYVQSLNDEGPSADTYYNLGNAYYRMGKIGQAVLSYERALKINPTHEDARINLEFVNGKIADRPEDDSAFLSQLHERIMFSMTPNTWAIYAGVFFLIFLICIAVYIFSGNITLRKWGFFGGIVVAIFFIYAVFTAIYSAKYSQSHDDAIVIVPTTYLTSSPRASKSATDKTVAIHEGTKIEIIDSLSTPDDPISPKWYNVKINNSTKAWVKSVDVERI